MYIVFFQRAARYCHNCFKKSDSIEKEECRREMEGALNDAAVHIHEDRLDQMTTELNYYFSLSAILNCDDLCQKCQKQTGKKQKGKKKKAAVHDYLSKTIIVPCRISIEQITASLEKQEFQQSAPKKTVKLRGNVLDFQNALLKKHGTISGDDDLMGA